MRSALACAAAGLALLSTGAGPAAAQAPAGDSVTGSLTEMYNSVTIDAHSGPAGENPTGTILYSGFRAFSYDVDVTCLAVDGTTAVIGFSGSYSFRGSPPFPTAGLARVVDGGDPGSGLDTVEWAATVGPEPESPPIPGPRDCSSFPGSFPFDGNPVFFDPATRAGDLTVVDAPALPTSKDQCKNGGWQTFGTYKNQGDCVSSVATGGKGRPRR